MTQPRVFDQTCGTAGEHLMEAPRDGACSYLRFILPRFTPIADVYEYPVYFVNHLPFTYIIAYIQAKASSMSKGSPVTSGSETRAQLRSVHDPWSASLPVPPVPLLFVLLWLVSHKVIRGLLLLPFAIQLGRARTVCETEREQESRRAGGRRAGGQEGRRA